MPRSGVESRLQTRRRQHLSSTLSLFFQTFTQVQAILQIIKMSQIDLIATIPCVPGKADRVVELLKEMAEYVKANEPDVLRYHINVETRKNGEQDVIMLETYKNKEALGSHGSSKEFKAFQKKLAAEGLVAGPMQLKKVKPAGGFASRL